MGVRVLIVDDDGDLRETVVRLLGRFGYSCLMASSGAEATEAIEAESPDLVVTDLHMPRIDGVAVARGARAHRPPIPVVLLSAYPMRMGHPQVQEAGATIHVAKPFANRDSCRRSNERWRGISSDRERLSPEVIDGTQTDGTV